MIEDEVGHCQLSSLGGALDHPAVPEKLWRLLKSKNALNVQDHDENALQQKVATDLEQTLEKLTRLVLRAGCHRSVLAQGLRRRLSLSLNGLLLATAN